MLASSSSSSSSWSAWRSHFAPPPPSTSLSERKKCTRRRHRKCHAAAAIKGENGEERGEKLEKTVTNQRNASFSFASVTRRRGFAAALSALFVVESSFRPSFAGQVIDSMQKMLDETDELLKNPELSSEEREGLEREKTFFEKQISRVQKNGEFVREQRERLLSTTGGNSYYASGIRIAVRDVKSETQFWETAMGMRVTSRDEKSGVVRLAYGRETLNEDDGGKASIEIYPLDSSSSSNSGINDSNTNVVEKLKYIQCTVPFGIRVSRVYEAGGELLYGFGYFDLRSPNGIPVIASVAKRRDSLEAVCLESTNVDATTNAIRSAFDDSLGIYDAKIPETKTEEDRKKLTSYVPPPPRGSKFLTALPYQKNEDGLRVDIFPDAATVRANMTFQEKLAEKAEQVRQKAFSGGSDEEDDEASARNTDDTNGTNFEFLGFRAVSNAKENKDVSSVGADVSNQWSLAVESLDAFEARVKEQQQKQ